MQRRYSLVYIVIYSSSYRNDIEVTILCKYIRIQNPEQVGTALKTLALRLRGTKTELEEAGEDTEGMAETVSQLQAKLKALTHGKVDIMINED